MGHGHWQQVEYLEELTSGMSVQVRQAFPFYTTFATGTVRDVRYWHQDYIESAPLAGCHVYVNEATIIVESDHGEVIFPMLHDCYIRREATSWKARLKASMKITETVWREHKEFLLGHWRRLGVSEIIISSQGFRVLRKYLSSAEHPIRWRGFLMYDASQLAVDDPCHESRLMARCESELDAGLDITKDDSENYLRFYTENS